MVSLGRAAARDGPASAIGHRHPLAGWVGQRLRALASDLAALPSPDYGWQAMVFLGEHALELHARHKGALRLLAVLAPAIDAETAQDIKRRFARLPAKRLVLRLGPGRAIRQSLALPASAEDVLATIMRNKVESLAPWPAGEALWGFRKRDEEASGKITLDIAIAGRRAIETILSCLAAAGIAVGHVDAAETPLAMDGIAIGFRGAEASQRTLRRLKYGIFASIALAGCAGLVGAYLMLADLSEMDGIERRTAALTEQVQARGREDGASGRRTEALALMDRKRAEAPFVNVLNTLTVSMPDDIWLETLDYADRRMTFTGRGQPTPSVIDALEKSPLFANVDFAAATQRSAAGEVDSFSISAAIEPAGGQP